MKNSVLLTFFVTAFVFVASSQTSKQQDMNPQDHLINAVLTSGRLGLIWEAIKAGGDINKPDKDGITPFMYAMSNTNLSQEAVDFLFAQSPKFTLTDNNGLTAFDWAALGFVKNSPQMQKLKKLKKNSSGKNPFIRALLEYTYASDKKSALVKLQKNVTRTNANLSMGQAGTILDLVFYYTTDTTPLDLLLAAGADVTAISISGVTHLMCAAGAHNNYAVNRLLSKSNNLNATDKNGNTALMYALSYAHSPDHQEIADNLIEKGSDINAINKQGLSVLMIAVIADCVDIVRGLIKRGVNTNVMDTFGDTAISIACKRRSSLAIQALLRASDIKKTINMPNQSGWTPLMYIAGVAPTRDTVKSVKALIAAGAKTVLPEASGFRSALFMALSVEKPSLAMISALLAASDIKESINVIDYYQGKTAVEYAQAEGYPDIATAIQNKMKQLGMLQK